MLPQYGQFLQPGFPPWATASSHQAQVASSRSYGLPGQMAQRASQANMPFQAQEAFNPRQAQMGHQPSYTSSPDMAQMARQLGQAPLPDPVQTSQISLNPSQEQSQLQAPAQAEDPATAAEAKEMQLIDDLANKHLEERDGCEARVCLGLTLLPICDFIVAVSMFLWPVQYSRYSLMGGEAIWSCTLLQCSFDYSPARGVAQAIWKKAVKAVKIYCPAMHVSSVEKQTKVSFSAFQELPLHSYEDTMTWCIFSDLNKHNIKLANDSPWSWVMLSSIAGLLLCFLSVVFSMSVCIFICKDNQVCKRQRLPRWAVGIRTTDKFRPVAKFLLWISAGLQIIFVTIYPHFLSVSRENGGVLMMADVFQLLGGSPKYQKMPGEVFMRLLPFLSVVVLRTLLSAIALRKVLRAPEKPGLVLDILRKRARGEPRGIKRAYRGVKEYVKKKVDNYRQHRANKKERRALKRQEDQGVELKTSIPVPTMRSNRAGALTCS